MTKPTKNKTLTTIQMATHEAHGRQWLALSNSRLNFYKNYEFKGFTKNGKKVKLAEHDIYPPPGDANPRNLYGFIEHDDMPNIVKVWCDGHNYSRKFTIEHIEEDSHAAEQIVKSVDERAYIEAIEQWVRETGHRYNELRNMLNVWRVPDDVKETKEFEEARQTLRRFEKQMQLFADMTRDACVLCGAQLPNGHPGRNNPSPLKEEGECCDECNTIKVVPARLKRLNRGVTNEL